jgi:tetratricopeptide (TPR) repeat protein
MLSQWTSLLAEARLLMDQDIHPHISLSLFWRGGLRIGIWLWHVIWWVWSSLLVGGLVVGALISLATTGTSGLSDPRTWVVIHPLLAHPLGAIMAFLAVVGLTLFSFFAHLSQKRMIQQRQQAHDEALVDLAKGIRHTLEKLNDISGSSPLPSSHTRSDVWHVPYRRNPFFTGREQLLKEIYELFTLSQKTARVTTQALCGLGGVGKTQTALEYAYRYREAYHFVLWVRAASRDTIITDFVALAEVLHLPERHERDQRRIVDAVKWWLVHHTGWLLIFDNVDDLEVFSDFLPTGDDGHILLTTQAQALGTIAHAIEVEKMDMEEGTLLLLRRAKLVEPDASLTLAQAIVVTMDGLPLALDQVGAYIEETACGLTHYWSLYQKRKADLLKRRGKGPSLYPYTVATTWSLSFQRVEEKNPAAADLLRLCAFLSPDAIPEEILIADTRVLGPVLAPVAADAFLLDQAIEALRAYSLVRRDPKEKTLSIHRLVQAVLQDTLEEAGCRRWAERAVLAAHAGFLHTEPDFWPQCERLLPHALLATQYIEQYLIIGEKAGHLLNQTASYLLVRARYAQAEPLFQQARQVWEQCLGPKCLQVATALHGLANLYQEQDQFAQAESLYLQALRIQEQHLGPEHPDVAFSLNGLAVLYYQHAKYAQAESLYLRALQVCEQHLGTEQHAVSPPLNGLANLYQLQGKYAQAEQLYLRALQVCEQHLGPEHPDVAFQLNGLATLYREQGKYAQAEPLFERALRIQEQRYGPEHPIVAYPLNWLANLYREQGEYAQAEPLYLRALQIREQHFGSRHRLVARSLKDLADLYRERGEYAQAEPLYLRALQIREQQMESEHPETAEALYGLAQLREMQGDSEEAKVRYARSLTVCEHALGTHHPKTMETRKRLVALLHALGQHEEAAQLEAVQSKS